MYHVSPVDRVQRRLQDKPYPQNARSQYGGYKKILREGQASGKPGFIDMRRIFSAETSPSYRRGGQEVKWRFSLGFDYG